jgi:hypothetical protein
LNSPSGCSNLLDLLKTTLINQDSKDLNAIRIELIEFFNNLVKGNFDLQKMLVFQGIFEELLKILQFDIENYKDNFLESSHPSSYFCLLNSLIEFNTSNLSYFRDTESFNLIKTILKVENLTNFWNPTKIRNVASILNLLGNIFRIENFNLEINQVKIHFFKLQIFYFNF